MHVLPFDSHNHVHMGSTSPLLALYEPKVVRNAMTMLQNSPPGNNGWQQQQSNSDNNSNHDNLVLPTPLQEQISVSGMAIMSTNPRDYRLVRNLAQRLSDVKPDDSLHVIPCFGVHPWWLHELTDHDWEEVTFVDDVNMKQPRWAYELEEILLQTPHSIVGEAGLDGFHFHPNTKQLTSPIDKQIIAFRQQMILAFKLQRPISIHVVQCFGPLLEVLQELKNSSQLPPILYFHAFGGKIGTVDQILAILGVADRAGKHVKQPSTKKAPKCSSRKVYFGFAPVINFRSPKTNHVIQHIGLHRIVLETDHEESILIPSSIQEGIEYLANIFHVSPEQIVHQTTQNAYDLYGIIET